MLFAVEAIGTYASDEEPALSEQERRDAEERLRRLLVGAPADRAWRRRGMLVLCRNRAPSSENSLDIKDACTGEDEQQELHRLGGACSSISSGENDRAAKIPKVEQREGSTTTRVHTSSTLGDVGTIVGTASGTTSSPTREGGVEIRTHPSSTDPFPGVVFKVVGLAEEELFREIVGFL